MVPEDFEGLALRIVIGTREADPCRLVRLGRSEHFLDKPTTGADPHEAIEGSDTEAVDQGYVSVTPLSVEATHADHFGVAAWVAGPEDEAAAQPSAEGRGP